MALQLTDLNSTVEYIDIEAARVPYSFTLKLDDKTYSFTVKHNDVGEFYTIDLYDTNGNILALGEVIRYGRPLFNVVEDERFPIPVIIPVSLTNDRVSEVTKDNFGGEVRLYLYEREVSE